MANAFQANAFQETVGLVAFQGIGTTPPAIISVTGWVEPYRNVTWTEPARSSGWVEPFRDVNWPYRP